jgi:hypothetical protein
MEESGIGEETMTIFIGTAGFPNIVINDLALVLTGDVGLAVDPNPSRLPAGLNPGQAVEVRYEQTIDDLGPRPPRAGPGINLRTELADAALAMDILTKLFLFIERDPEQLSAQNLFALQDADRPATVGLAAHMKSILVNVEKWIDRLDERTRQWKPD